MQSNDQQPGALDLYHQMARTRAFEERIASLYSERRPQDAGHER